MSGGLLLDSHVLLWLEAQAHIRAETQRQIVKARATQSLFVSDISVWEIGVAYYRKSFERRPDLGHLSVDAWFRRMTENFDIKPLRITNRIAIEAAHVPGIYGSGDPGDCFLIATARIRNLTLVTRDGKILDVAKDNPNYLSVMPC